MPNADALNAGVKVVADFALVVAGLLAA